VRCDRRRARRRGERDAGEPVQPVPYRPRSRPAALECEDEDRLGARPDPADLAILVEAKGSSLRVAHVGILQHAPPNAVVRRTGYRSCVGDVVFLKLGRRHGLRRATPATDSYERGRALEARDPAGAMTAYQRAIAGRPDLADAHNNLGRLHHDRGELALAESYYRIALCCVGATDATAMKPPAPRAKPAGPHRRCARRARRGGRRAVLVQPRVVLEDQGRAGEAIAAYERALSIDLALADAHWNLARLLELHARRAGDALLLRRAVRHLVQYRSLARTSHGGR